MHHTPLIATIAVSFVFAFILGMIANRLKFPPIVGYLLAGILVGPFTPGFVADADLAVELAEIGVILLMFGVGLHFSYKDLFAVRNIAIPGAVAHWVRTRQKPPAAIFGFRWRSLWASSRRLSR